ncbi:MAG: YgjV family protein [Ruminococcaceae bacterium]|nr:YgjV family protein [Oscillospiraceae bacterium]
MEYDLFYIIGQLFGVIAVVLGFIAFQRKTQLGIILFQCATALVFSAHYFLISAPTAVALNVLSAMICVFFAFRDKLKGKSKVEVIVSSLLIILAGALTWENAYSVFLIAGLMINVISLSFSNPQNTRRAMLLKSPLCIAYNLAVTSIGGVVFESAVLTSAIIGLIKNKVREK